MHGILEVFGKSLKTEFRNILTENDIIYLKEKWTTVQSNINISGYERVHRHRKKRRRRGNRSGGIIVYNKNPLNQVSQKYTILMVIYSGYNLTVGCLVLRRTSIVVVYTSGSNNCNLLQLQKDIERFSKSGEILLCGDFNGRTACLDDFVKNDYMSTHIQRGSGYSTESKHNILRQNKDAKVNNNWGEGTHRFM